MSTGKPWMPFALAWREMKDADILRNGVLCRFRLRFLLHPHARVGSDSKGGLAADQVIALTTHLRLKNIFTVDCPSDSHAPTQRLGWL
jgi:hypothetical protein